MRNLFLFFASAILVTACNNSAEVKSASTAKNSDLVGQNLKGKVQQYVESSYTVDSAGVSKMDSLMNVSDFDEKGYQPRYATKDSSGKVHTDTHVSHDEKGNVTEVVTTMDGKQTYKLITEIDKDGKYSGGKTYDTTGKPDSYFTDISSNDYGIVTGGKQHFMDGRIKSAWQSKYDGPNYIGGMSTDSTGKVSGSDSLTLNDKGDVLEMVSTTREKDATKTEKTSYKYDSYDDKGNWTQRTMYNEKGKPSKIVKRTFTYYKD